MAKDEAIVTFTAEELAAIRARGESTTDWERIARMSEEELEASIASDPDWADVPSDWHEKARPFFPRGAKQQITLRIDPDVLAWFKSHGPGYQTRINAALRAFVAAHERETR